MKQAIWKRISTGIAGIIFLCSAMLSAQVYPNFKIKNEKTPRTMASGGSVQVPIDVELMKGHHLYVRHASSMSFNIVTSFNTDAKKGFAVAATTLPEGRRYKDDYVLDGKGKGAIAGRYVVTVFETRGVKPGPRTYPVKINIRTQVCNQKTNVCYRPKTFTHTMMFKVMSPKVETALRSNSRINWVTSIDAARAKARKSGKNIYTIVTAPTWCGYCKHMERTTFQDDQVVAALNNQFVALRILDSNPDHRKISFSGYPTHLIHDKNFKELKRGMSRQPSGLVSSLQEFVTGGDTKEEEEVVEEIGGKTYNYSVTITGKFENKGNGRWVSTDSRGQKQEFKENKRGKNHIILKSIKNETFIAVPIQGGQGYIYKNGKWVEYFNMDAPN